MPRMRTVTEVPDEQLAFVLELFRFQGATTSVERTGATSTVKAVFPDTATAAEAASITLPSPLATETAAQAEPIYLPTTEPLGPPVAGDSFAELAVEYRRNYDLFTVDPRHEKEIAVRVDKLRTNKERYAALSTQTGIPWQFIGVLHMMESNCNFAAHLHNGDPLTDRTKRVPAGRPVKGKPPFTWEVSALDALEYEGFTKTRDWSIAAMLYRCERFNGMGYRSHGIHSPYLWSYCNLYQKGRFTDDHRFDQESVSRQCGAAILLKRLLAQA